ncbi:HAMP domain-containing methyl-accepting chemotaxis protein [Saccharibacillus kuerlensis]|uniref:Methyl-accepting chemotaxis protein TlpB n=1 Tax=Saccharibacillus kuerlensis TaxID=459527 RepID=A0ABQ2KZP3_9BACL|nr:methyl-accepting chemotaxis protein [Saccharibacillus kuerlensis]GGN96418.1 methyl-accepting chemotaxis protein TlpB [Saccharibacillus kuerlensis]
MRLTKGRRFSLSLGNKLLIFFISILVVALLASAILSYQSAKSALSAELLMNSASSVQTMNAIIDRDLKSKVATVDYLAETLNSASFQSGGAESGIINSSLETYDLAQNDVDLAYAGSETGVFIASNYDNLPEGFDPRTRDWYNLAMKNPDKAVISEPYISATTDTTGVAIAKRLNDGSGVVALDISLDSLLQTRETIQIGTGGYAFIMTSEGTYISHPTIEAGSSDSVSMRISDQGTDSGTFHYTFESQPKVLVYETNELSGWIIAGSYYENEVQTAAQPILYRLLLVLAASLLIGGTIIWLLTRSIARRLGRVTKAAEAISSGNLTSTINDSSRDEIGQLADSFQRMNTSLGSLIRSITSSVSDVAASSEQLSASAEHTGKASRQITEAIEGFAAVSERQNEKVSDSSQRLEEVFEWLAEIRSGSERLAVASRSSAEMAEEGDLLVDRTLERIREIDGSVREGGEVISGLADKSKTITGILHTIDEIASQTNLLALNASIEAARAGEAGLGFTVVASEVKKLAQQSADSAKMIEGLIQDIVSDIRASLETFVKIRSSVTDGLESAELTADNLRRLKTASEHVADDLNGMNTRVGEVTGHAEEVAQSVREIAKAAEANQSGTHEIAAAAEEQLASMEEIRESSSSLAGLAEQLQEEVEKFQID